MCVHMCAGCDANVVQFFLLLMLLLPCARIERVQLLPAHLIPTTFMCVHMRGAGFGELYA